MRRTITTILLLISLNAYAKCTSHDSWTSPDKALHFAMGAGVGTYVAADHGFWYGFGAGALAGLGKEALDSASGSGTCSLQDFAVTAIGAAVGAGFGVYLSHRGNTTTIGLVKQF